eukprot:CAMPEP_0180309168 /NCGR_PEP_ID=MMETSP0988-20121125/28933_1 /TAXON_ID=697907 /ORGANISM="non described non described, Strain CCMP2293" /LENGTH=103 /DNA_ID=CAMNT_0022292885 /DNA_START=29 /DNA_END=340 /DNA_ORIENTATION=+
MPSPTCPAPPGRTDACASGLRRTPAYASVLSQVVVLVHVGLPPPGLHVPGTLCRLPKGHAVAPPGRTPARTSGLGQVVVLVHVGVPVAVVDQRAAVGHMEDAD